MKREFYFPVAIILLSLGASLVYAMRGDLRHALYFFFGACITAVSTF